MWASFLEFIRVVIFAAAHICGGSLGAGIVAVSVVVRLALMPLTLRLARHARIQQRRLAAIAPELQTLKRRYANDPARLMRETQELYAANDIRFLSPAGFVGMLVQLPLLGGLFATVRAGLGARVRFLWVRNLAAHDLPLMLIVTALAGAAAILAPQPTGPGAASTTRILLLVSVGGTLFFLWSASSAVALSLGAGSLVSALQGWILSRDARAPAPVA